MSTTAPKVVNILYDVYMGWSHRTLMQLLQANFGVNQIKRGELAVFMNRTWTACKIMAPDNTMLYWRSTNGTQITLDQLKSLPSRFGSGRFTMDGKIETGALKRYQNLLQGALADIA